MKEASLSIFHPDAKQRVESFRMYGPSNPTQMQQWMVGTPTQYLHKHIYRNATSDKHL